MQTIINGRQFEWDDNKAKINKIKHGVSFKVAARVFGDVNKMVRRDDEHSFEEERWQIIGKVDDILFVVYTERGDFTRLISAREATPKERKMYYDHKNVYKF